jgi:hypothetical protein
MSKITDKWKKIRQVYTKLLTQASKNCINKADHKKPVIKNPQDKEKKCIFFYLETNMSLKFLLPKEFICARLTTFSEKPEAYLSWKKTFWYVMSELNVEPSSNYARSTRSRT